MDVWLERWTGRRFQRIVTIINRQLKTSDFTFLCNICYENVDIGDMYCLKGGGECKSPPVFCGYFSTTEYLITVLTPIPTSALNPNPNLRRLPASLLSDLRAWVAQRSDHGGGDRERMSHGRLGTETKTNN